MYSPWQGPSARYPVKRKLVFTPASVKRSKPTAVSKYSGYNRRTLRGPRTRGSLYAQVKSLQKVVKRISPELKNLDVSVSQTGSSSVGSITHITAVSGGSGSSTRVGNTIDLTGLVFRFKTTQFIANAYARVFVIQDRQQLSDTTPTVSDIFSTLTPVTAQPNADTISRFNFLWTSPMLDGTMLNSGNQRTTYEWSWKGSKKISFNGTASSDIDKGGIYVVMLQETPSTNFVISGSVRLQFTDA